MDAENFFSPAQIVELPGEIVHMAMHEDRLFVTLIDGRIIDMTDWFAADAQRH